MRPIIETHDLTKVYRIRSGAARYRSLRDDVAATMRRGLRRAGDSAYEDLRALDDVSFSVDPGEVVGVIGKNGSGKSTLLKILSRIVAPTTGRAVLRGRVASLLEVGTGFHPELTGRENISLNGAILGMRRREIAGKFDDIVAFAGVERFLDTPVKFYSSGMYVRLAFAVAAHLEPDVLLVDEVLAVGDVEFQSKSIGRMSAVAREGRTVLFVSHNMAAVQELCDRAVLLQSGRVAADGAISDVVQQYLRANVGHATVDLAERRDRQGNGKVRLLEMTVVNQDGSPTIRSFDELRISLRLGHAEPVSRLRVDIGVYDPLGRILFRADSGRLDRPDVDELTVSVGRLNLADVHCQLNVLVYVDNDEWGDYVQNAYSFRINRNPEVAADEVRQYDSALATVLVPTRFEY
jgi:lipopolysaccharide transport system ATP-binding protein